MSDVTTSCVTETTEFVTFDVFWLLLSSCGAFFASFGYLVVYLYVVMYYPRHLLVPFLYLYGPHDAVNVVVWHRQPSSVIVIVGSRHHCGCHKTPHRAHHSEIWRGELW